MSMSATDENIEAVKKIILNNLRIIIREVAYDVVISFGSCQANFTDNIGKKTCDTSDYSKIVKF